MFTRQNNKKNISKKDLQFSLEFQNAVISTRKPLKAAREFDRFKRSEE